MNRLQNLKTERQYFVSLNRAHKIEESSIIAEMDYTHPTYTFASMSTQKHLQRLNGKRGTYFCGSYFGYGFHEDGARSAIRIGKTFGIDL